MRGGSAGPYDLKVLPCTLGVPLDLGTHERATLSRALVRPKSLLSTLEKEGSELWGPEAATPTTSYDTPNTIKYYAAILNKRALHR